MWPYLMHWGRIESLTDRNTLFLQLTANLAVARRNRVFRPVKLSIRPQYINTVLIEITPFLADRQF